MTGQTALIVGGGVAGLSSAWWLAQAGWKTLVVENNPNLRADGYMLGLSGPGHHVARRMGLLPALQSRSRAIHENLHLDRQGRVVLRLRYGDFLKGLEWVTLARNELAEALYETVRDRADVRFGTTVADLADRAGKVEATLTDGSHVEADLVIGADGIRSPTRTRLFGDDPAHSAHLGYRVAAFQVADSLGLGNDFLSYVEPGRIAEFYTLAEGRLATLYIWRSDETGFVPAGERLARLKTAFRGAHPSATRWLDLLTENDPMFFDTMTLIDMPRWSKGRVLLLGDSAHCLTLISGQGAGMAMTSACILAEELAKGDLDGALARHEARMRPAIRGLQRRTRRMAAWFIPEGAVAFRLRNAMLRSLPRRLLAWHFMRGIRSEILTASEGL